MTRPPRPESGAGNRPWRSVDIARCEVTMTSDLGGSPPNSLRFHHQAAGFSAGMVLRSLTASAVSEYVEWRFVQWFPRSACPGFWRFSSGCSNRWPSGAERCSSRSGASRESGARRSRVIASRERPSWPIRPGAAEPAPLPSLADPEGAPGPGHPARLADRRAIDPPRRRRCGLAYRVGPPDCPGEPLHAGSRLEKDRLHGLRLPHPGARGRRARRVLL